MSCSLKLVHNIYTFYSLRVLHNSYTSCYIKILHHIDMFPYLRVLYHICTSQLVLLISIKKCIYSIPKPKNFKKENIFNEANDFYNKNRPRKSKFWKFKFTNHKNWHCAKKRVIAETNRSFDNIIQQRFYFRSNHDLFPNKVDIRSDVITIPLVKMQDNDTTTTLVTNENDLTIQS